MDSEDSGDTDEDLLGSDRITRSSSSDIIKPRPPVPAEQPATFFKVAAVMAAGLLADSSMLLPSPVTCCFWITDSRGVC